MPAFASLRKILYAVPVITGLVIDLCLAAPFAPPLRVVGNTLQDANNRVVCLEGFSVYDANMWNDKSIVANWKNNWKVNIVRLTFHPPNWLNKDASSQEQYLKRTDTFLQWCKEYQIYVVIDGYHESGSSGGVNSHWQNCKKAWPILAKRYKDVDHILWEVYNEPYENGVSDQNLWKSWVPKAQELVDTIRSYNPVVTACIVPAVRWAQVAFLDQAKVEREQIIYSFHPYPPCYGDSGHWSKATWSKHFGYISEQKIAPLFIGEWWARTQGALTVYAPLLTSYMHDIGASQTLWGYFPGWGGNLVDNGNGEPEKINSGQGRWYYNYLNSLSSIRPAAPSAPPVTKPRFTVASGSLWCHRIGAEIALRIFDMQGRLIYSHAENPGSSEVYGIPLPFEKMPDGKYFMELDAGGGKEIRVLPVMK